MWDWVKSLGRTDEEELQEHMFVLTLDKPKRSKARQVIQYYGGLPPLLPPPEDRRYDN